MILFTFENRFTFFYEIHHGFSMTVNIFGAESKFLEDK